MAVEIASSEARSQLPLFVHEAPVSLGVVSDLLRGLNREQRRAVTHGDGPQLVVCGPGTGKTEVVTRRIAWLIATKRARPREILGLTFTDNAATEMQARVDTLVPYGQADAAIHTFHAFGDRLLRECAFELGLPGDLRLIGRSEAIVLLRDNLFTLGLDRYRPLGNPTRFLGALVDLFQRAKDEDVSPADLLAFANSRPPEPADALGDTRAAHLELARAFERYQDLLVERGLIDHGDQIALPLRLLRRRPHVRATVAQRYRYVLVDEFQDMNRTQLELVLALAGTAANVTVVGDPDQAIYTFRGAASDNIARFVSAFPGLRQVTLRRNYRSRAPIVEAARRVAAYGGGSTPVRAPETVAHRRSRNAPPVRSTVFPTAESEADGVAALIAERVAEGRRPSDFAVLTRSNSEIDLVSRSLRVRDIAVQTHLPADFLSRPEVRPLVAFLRVVADPQDTLELYALATAEPYRLGGEALTAALNLARRTHRSLWDILSAPDRAVAAPREFVRGVDLLVEHVRAALALAHERSSGEVLYDYARRTGLLSSLARGIDAGRARAVARLFEIVRERASLLSDDRVACLVPHLDSLSEGGEELDDTGPLDAEDAVSVLTVHRAKGLEFPIVFITGLTDGRFPSRGRPAVLELPWAEIRGSNGSDTDRVDEERRLFYVAVTRARDELYLTHHQVAGKAGNARRPSQFIAEALDVASASSVSAPDPIARIHSLGAPQPTTPVPSDATPVTELSFSALQDYMDCPERYRLRYVVGLPSPAHHALSYGSAMHQAVAAFHVSVSRGAPLSEEHLLAEFNRAWSPEGFVSREHEEARFATGRRALLAFREAQLRDLPEVIAVERPFVFQLDDVRIRGRMDRLDKVNGGHRIVDYKSSEVREQGKANEKARDSLQLQVYALAHEANTGSLPSEVALHFLDTGVVGTALPDPKRLARARAKMRAATEGIRAAAFAPKPDVVACGYCPFRQICSVSAA